MAESIRRIQYFYVMAPDKPGEGARALQTLKEAGVNLLAFSGFPASKRAQLDFVPEDPAAFRAVARKAKWKVTGPKVGFLIEGDDRTGVMADIYQKLAAARINITASGCDEMYMTVPWTLAGNANNYGPNGAMTEMGGTWHAILQYAVAGTNYIIIHRQSGAGGFSGGYNVWGTATFQIP